MRNIKSKAEIIQMMKNKVKLAANGYEATRIVEEAMSGQVPKIKPANSNIGIAM